MALEVPMGCPELPPPELLKQQADWLVTARSKLLRQAGIAHRRQVLDLGCGYGSVTQELVHRCGGQVTALDRNPAVFAQSSSCFVGATTVCASAEQLPFDGKAFDLVFCQFALLWMNMPLVLKEIRRVLKPDGLLAALEPDYGGLMEYPAEIGVREIWIAALSRAGADPMVGRRLPGLLANAGFQAEIALLDRLETPSALRFDFLEGLPLTEEEHLALRQVKEQDLQLAPSMRVAHLPVFLVRAQIGGLR